MSYLEFQLRRGRDGWGAVKGPGPVSRKKIIFVPKISLGEF